MKLNSHFLICTLPLFKKLPNLDMDFLPYLFDHTDMENMVILTVLKKSFTSSAILQNH